MAIITVFKFMEAINMEDFVYRWISLIGFFCYFYVSHG